MDVNTFKEASLVGLNLCKAKHQPHSNCSTKGNLDVIEIIWPEMPEQLYYIMHVSTAACLSQDLRGIHHTSKGKAAFPPALHKPPGWGFSMGHSQPRNCPEHETQGIGTQPSLPECYFPQGETFTMFLEAPLCGITQLIFLGAEGFQPVRPWFGKPWGAFCQAFLHNEPAGKLSFTHREKAISNLLFTILLSEFCNLVKTTRMIPKHTKI